MQMALSEEHISELILAKNYGDAFEGIVKLYGERKLKSMKLNINWIRYEKNSFFSFGADVVLFYGYGSEARRRPGKVE